MQPEITPQKITIGTYLRTLGPGIVWALSVLGAGDIVDSSVAGSNYGYTLMWALMLAIFLRFVALSLYAKYQLCNPHGETILDGFSRVGKWMQWYMVIALVACAFIWAAANAAGTAEILSHLIPGIPQQVLGVLAILVAIALILKGGYKTMEKTFQVILAVMAVSMLFILLRSGPDWGNMFAGTFTPMIPPGMGVFGGAVILAAVVGSVGGAMGNLFYGSMIQEKGWNSPEHRKFQMFDLGFALFVTFLLNWAVWGVAADIVKPMGIAIQSAADMSNALTGAMGGVAGYLFYLGLFGAIYTNLIGISMGQSLAASEVYYKRIKGQPLTNYRQTDLFKWGVVICFIFGLVAILTKVSFVPLLIFSMALQPLLTIVLSITLFYITNKKEYIGEKYVNKWYENVLLTIIILFTLYVSVNLAINIIKGLLS